MASVNVGATHKFVIVLNEKSPPGKLLSATGQIAMALYKEATAEEQLQMSFTPLFNPEGNTLITVSTCSFVVLKGTEKQLLTLYAAAYQQGLRAAIFTSTMSFNGVEENLIEKTATTPLDQTEPYGVGLFGAIEEVAPLTKKFSVFK
ncbi:MAG: DUF2000 family protein [Verrucomicrobia bacterium]|nr:DUF2000 family protein [Verrucomicrobiota bacterium]